MLIPEQCWHQNNADTRTILTPEECWYKKCRYQKNAGTRTTLTPESFWCQRSSALEYSVGASFGSVWGPEENLIWSLESIHKAFRDRCPSSRQLNAQLIAEWHCRHLKQRQSDDCVLKKPYANKKADAKIIYSRRPMNTVLNVMRMSTQLPPRVIRLTFPNRYFPFHRSRRWASNHVTMV